MAPTGYLETGVIYCDDNLHRMAQFPDQCVHLVYLDPPFFSNRHYEVIWGDEAEVRSFEDRWEGGIHVYVEWMRERVIELRRILKPTGSLYLHADWHAAHYLNVMVDEVFGDERFLWSGPVADWSVDDGSTFAIRALNVKLATDDRVDLAIVPIGDGLTLLRARRTSARRDVTP